MNLAEALRAHTACSHSLAISIGDRSVALTHAGGTQTVSGEQSTAAGSAMFHECARRIFGDGEGHCRG